MNQCIRVVFSVVEWKKQSHQAGNGGISNTKGQQQRKPGTGAFLPQVAKEVQYWVASERKVPIEDRPRWRVRKQGSTPCSTEMGDCNNPCRATREMVRSNSRQQHTGRNGADGNPETQRGTTTAVQNNH